jgi:hypothetical protein
LHLVGYLYYWQMGFNSVFKGLITKYFMAHVKEKRFFCGKMQNVSQFF